MVLERRRPPRRTRYQVREAACQRPTPHTPSASGFSSGYRTNQGLAARARVIPAWTPRLGAAIIRLRPGFLADFSCLIRGAVVAAGQYDAFRVLRSGGVSGAVSVARGPGAVASASRQASDLAIDVLQAGGNAFDAAFSLAFSLCLYHPQAGNIGGGGYVLFCKAGDDPGAFDYREQAPRAARREAFLLQDGTADPDLTAYGPASVCVPGTVKAFFELHRRFGVLSARDLLHGIARRCEEGALVTQYEADCLNRLGPRLAASPEARRLYVRPRPFVVGDLLPNPGLARTLDLLSVEGDAAFYRGAIAESIVSDLSANGGFVAAEDLADYAIREVQPISMEVAGQRVWTVPPEAGGGLLLEILGILDRDETRQIPRDSPRIHHLLAQACKIAFIDRLDWHGDIPEAAGILSEKLGRNALDARFACLDLLRDIPTDVLANRIRLLGSDVLNQAPQAGPGAASGPSGKNTTHFAVVDAQGNAVSNSYTLNLRYGSKWAVDGAGFLLNGSIDSFSFAEGACNYYGVPGSAPNRFRPGARPASNMAPVLVTAGGQVRMALGTPGGPTIPTALAGVLFAILSHGVPPDQAVRAGRLHQQGWPDVLSHEPGFDRPDLLTALAAMGYPLKDKQETIADVHGVFRDGDSWLAVSDLRREGAAAAIQG